jgi:hypothetical protein
MHENAAAANGDHLAQGAGESFAWPSSGKAMANPHRPDCRERQEKPAAESIGYADHFCDCHDFPEPLVHANGTDISWPRGWSCDDALRWRAEHKLLAVGG